MKEVAVAGDEDFLVGFRLAGVRNTFNIEDTPEDTVRELLGHDEIGIVVVKDELIQSLPQRMQDEVNDSVDPVFVKLGEERSGLRSKIQRAIGVDLWQQGDADE